MAHTPGPWTVDDHQRGANGASIIGANRQRVVSLPKAADRPYDQKADDARLIAAAPELLAALREVMDASHEEQELREVGVESDDTFRRLVMARANALKLIAKVEGKA